MSVDDDACVLNYGSKGNKIGWPRVTQVKIGKGHLRVLFKGDIRLGYG